MTVASDRVSLPDLPREPGASTQPRRGRSDDGAVRGIAESDGARIDALASDLRVSRTLAALLTQRGIAEAAGARTWLDPKLAQLSAPDGMLDRERAAERLADACRRGETVAVFGDYDVDGTTSTVLLSEGLERLGARPVPLLANRFSGGYGLSEPAVDGVLATSATLLVTCDVGSADHERIARAKKAGLDVIVVDHHLVPSQELPADAFLNPHRPGCGFPYKGLASVGLVFSLVAAVRAKLGAKLDVRPLLDLVALGTIADVAPLDGDNRALVRFGLGLVGQMDRPGIAALGEAAKIRAGASIGGIDVSFRLAPRLNAAGRLGAPDLSLMLLRARSLAEARPIAARIEAINDERKALQARITAEAVVQARSRGEVRGLVVGDAGWHRGVVGIVAARVVEVFEAPAIVVAFDGDGPGHGSGRAPAGFPLHQAIQRCAHLLVRFGGHDAACGVTIARERLDEFAAAFAESCADIEREAGYAPRGRGIDLVLDGDAWPVPSARELALLEPLGHRNPEPRFLLDGVPVEDAGAVGDGHLKLMVRVGKTRLPCFGLGLASELETIGSSVRLSGSLRRDDFRGGDAVELRIDRILATERPTADVRPLARG